MKSIVPSLWFADNSCQEAIEDYISVFPHSKINDLTLYPEESLNEHFEGMAGKIINADFTLNGQRFIAIDGGPYFRFNEAISFTIECEDQREIDYYWERLSHDIEAEQCGWCRDRYGLSWQIVPHNMAELSETAGQIQAMMQMKKIIISELEAARF